MMRKNFSSMIGLFLLVGILVFTAGPASAGEDEWTTTSLAGFTLNAITFDPTNSNVFYAATDRGLLVSRDNALTWRGTGKTSSNISAVAVNPDEPATIYIAGNGQLFKSTDGGETWATLGTGVLNQSNWVGFHPLRPWVVYVATRDGLFRSPDGGNTWANAGLPSAGQVQNIAFDPTNADVIYVVLFNNQGMFRTNDGGQSWSLLEVGFENANSQVSQMVINSEGSLFVVGNFQGVYRTTDGGQSWQANQPGEGFSNFYNSSLAVDPQSNKLYLGNNQALFRSENGGISWVNIEEAFPSRPGRIIPDPHREGVVYALINGQLYKSVDDGNIWQGSELKSFVEAVAAHPAYPGLVFGFYDRDRGQLWRSQDGTQNWIQNNVNLEGTFIQTIAFDPVDANRVYAGTTNGLYRSSDAGQTWNITGLPTNVQVFSVAVDPMDNSHLFVGGSTGLLISVNDGESWTGAPFDRGVGSVAIDSQTSETIYAVSNGDLYRSSNSGESWQTLSHPSQSLTSIALKPGDSNTIYTGANDGIFISRDGGSTWTKAPQIQPTSTTLFGSYTLVLQIDPHRPEAVYAAFQSNLYISPDAGANWFQLGKGALGLIVTDLAVDAGDPLTLYATFQEGAGGVWRYTMNELPEAPTPTSTPTSVPTITPRPTLTPAVSATPVSRLAATGTALAVANADREATAESVFGPNNQSGSDGDGSSPPTGPAQTDNPEESGGIGRWLIGITIVVVIVGGGFAVWRFATSTSAPSTAPAVNTCPNCEAVVPPGGRFCARCGHPMNEQLSGYGGQR